MGLGNFWIKKRSASQQTSPEKMRQVVMTGLMRMSALSSERMGTDENSDRKILVSLTTFPKRIDDVYICIESLLQQTLKPNRLILWISKEEFSDGDIPESLRNQMKRGLEVRFCDKDIGPYKKIIPSLREFSNYKIITVDDDVIYPSDLVDKLYRSYLSEPSVIHAMHAHKICFDGRGMLMPYKKWQRPTQDVESSLLTYPVGIGGVLYFPGCFSTDVTDERRFLELAPMADDVWLKAMSLRAGVRCRKVTDERPWDARYIVIEGSQKFALKRKNKSASDGNDYKISRVFAEYGIVSLLLDS